MRRRNTINQINVVPYIDVMLVLLVIFMVTAPLITPGEIELPSVGQKTVVPTAPLQVRVYRAGAVTLRDMQTGGRETPRMGIPELATRVRDKQSGASAQPVVIEADREVRYAQVIEVLDALKRAGAQKVGLAVTQAK
jgi:biopolymer transport protein TolR